MKAFRIGKISTPFGLKIFFSSWKMHLKIFVSIGLILFGSVSLGQSRYTDQKDDSDEMGLNARNLARAARREERLEGLAELLNVRRDNSNFGTRRGYSGADYSGTDSSGVDYSDTSNSGADYSGINKCAIGYILLGVGTDKKLWTRAALECDWVPVKNTQGLVTAVTQLKDHTILGVGIDNKLWTRATLESNWVQVDTNGMVIAVTQLHDGTILGVGTDNKLWTRATLSSNWVQVDTNGMVVGVTQLKTGTIVGVGTDKKLWTRANLASSWVPPSNSQGDVIAVAAMSS